MRIPGHQDSSMRRHLGALLLLVVMTASRATTAGDVPKNGGASDSSAEVAPAAGKQAEPTVPTMQSSHVAMLSNAFAAKRIGAFNYQVTQLAYEVEPGSRRWTIHYELGPAPDGSKPDPAQFDVWVDDPTGKLSFADDR
jgi:hypothetical protein